MFVTNQCSAYIRLLVWYYYYDRCQPSENFFFDCLFASPPSPPPCSASASASLFHRFLHIPPLSQPPFIFFLDRSMQGSAAGLPYVPEQLSTPPGQGGRIGGMVLTARTTVVLISSAGACWSPRCEVSPKRVSMACLVCGTTGKSPLRRNLRTRILISAVLVYQQSIMPVPGTTRL